MKELKCPKCGWWQEISDKDSPIKKASSDKEFIKMWHKCSACGKRFIYIDVNYDLLPDPK
jgi:transcriptional regulator NrdR family protein